VEAILDPEYRLWNRYNRLNAEVLLIAFDTISRLSTRFNVLYASGLQQGMVLGLKGYT